VVASGTEAISAGERVPPAFFLPGKAG